MLSIQRRQNENRLQKKAMGDDPISTALCMLRNREAEKKAARKKTTRLASLHLTLLFVQETNERAEDTHSKQKNTKKKSMKRPRTKKRARARAITAPMMVAEDAAVVTGQFTLNAL